MRAFATSFLSAALLTLAAAPSAFAAETAFHAGSVITGYGKVATVDADMAIPKNMKFKVRFDVRPAATPGEVNRSFDTAARFISMHVEHGVPLKNINLAIVVHGPATVDLAKDELYSARNGVPNATAPLIAELIKNGVKIYVCGQAAAMHDVAKEDLLPGVEVALSAMTAHAVLDAEGYVLNPF